MARNRDSGRIELKDVFLRMQKCLLAQLAAGEVFEHPTAAGAASEQQWIELLNQYLPQRYHASNAFVVDADGRRSRQIDIAIYDRFYSPVLFSHESGFHVPAESVYAVFEVKHFLTRQLLLDAGRKAASVRRLRRTSVGVPSAGGKCPAKRPHRILAGVVATRSAWTGDFGENVSRTLDQLEAEEALDLGCVLEQGTFETGAAGKGRQRGARRFSKQGEALIFFLIRLIERLRQLGSAPAVDLMEYGRGLESAGGSGVLRRP